MAPAIGPQLPADLQKRKRLPEDDLHHAIPPAKSLRRGNKDAAVSDDGESSEDSYGPSAPPSVSRPKIGPSLPPNGDHREDSSPHTPRPEAQIGPQRPRTSADNFIFKDDSDSDATGPAAPGRRIGSATKPTIGQAPPPADLSQRPPRDSGSDSGSDSDGGWGPALPSAAGTQRSASTQDVPQAPEPVAPKRDDWMVAPPTSSGYKVTDPTKLKNRKFASGRSAGSGSKASGVSSIWTETPEEKARRLANAVLGRTDPSEAAAQVQSGPRSSSSRRADEEKIRAFTEQIRGRSLTEEHQAARKAGKKAEGGCSTQPGKSYKEEEDDPSKRAFDWEKDMKVGGQISKSQRKQLLNRAANFGGRFEKGNYL